jgi:putative thioredoxin
VTSQHVIDVDSDAFTSEVLDRSHELPVVVDFWAEWCGPCKTLGPQLEEAVEARDGAVLLAKVDVDDNQQLAQQHGVQGIPAVKAFVDGEVVDEFVGAVNRSHIEGFLDGLPAAGAPAADPSQATGAAGDAAPVDMDRLEELSDHAQANQDDEDAMLAYGTALAEAGFATEAAEVLLATVALQGERKEDAREALVDVLDDVPDERANDVRRRLTALLF